MDERESAIAVFESILKTELVPPGFFRSYVEDNLRWLSNQSLETCDAGRYSIVIDSSGNVSPCLAHKSVGNLLETSLNELLKRFDRQAIQECSDKSSCNMLCSRVVGKNLRHPISGLATLLPMRKIAKA